MDQDKVQKEVDEKMEVSDVNSGEKIQIPSENVEEQQHQDSLSSDYSNIDSIGSNESFSKYVYDRTAPSFFMILAEQEISRNESLIEEENHATVIDQKRLDDKLKDVEKQNEDQPEENKVRHRENVRFLSQEEILGPKVTADELQKENELIDQTEVIHADEKLEDTEVAVQPVTDQTDESAVDDSNVEKESSRISFQHVVYDDDMTVFKIQPEIADIVPKKQVTLRDDNETYYFGTPKASQIEEEKFKEEEFCNNESVVPRSRSYGVLANIVLKTVSQYSTNRQMPLDEIRKQISMAEMQREISSEEVSLLEAAVEQIDKCEELKTVDIESDKGLETLKQYIAQLFDVLRSILFGDSGDKQNDAEDGKEEKMAEINLTPSNTSIEQLATSAIKEDEESPAEILRRILFGSHMQIRKEYESKICVCNRKQEPQLEKNSEIDIETADGLLRTVRRSTIASKSEESVVNEIAKTRSIEDALKAVKSQTSMENYEEKSNLQKFKNEEDLTTIGVTSSPSFVMRTSDIEDTAFVKNPKSKNTITVQSISSVHMRKANVLPLIPRHMSSQKYDDDFSNALIRDLNDDGYINLPKVPSTTLSSVASKAWIHENASFYVDEKKPKETTAAEKPTISEKPALIGINNVIKKQQDPHSETSSVYEQAASSSANEKSKGKFRKCRCFLRKFFRGSKDEKKK